MAVTSPPVRLLQVRTLGGEQATFTVLDGEGLSEVTVDGLKLRPDWKTLLKGVPSDKQLVLWDGHALEGHLSLCQQGVTPSAGVVCLRVVVADGKSPATKQGKSRLKYLETFVDDACTALARSKQDGQRRKVALEHRLEKQRRVEAVRQDQDKIRQQAITFGQAFSSCDLAEQARLGQLAVDNGFSTTDVETVFKQRDWAINWVLTGLEKTGASSQQFLLSLHEYTGLVVGPASSSTTFKGHLGSQGVLAKNGALSAAAANELRHESQNMWATVVQLRQVIDQLTIDLRSMKVEVGRAHDAKATSQRQCQKLELGNIALARQIRLAEEQIGLLKRAAMAAPVEREPAPEPEPVYVPPEPEPEPDPMLVPEPAKLE